MSVNLTIPETIYEIAGVSFGASYAGIRKKALHDLLIIKLDENTVTSGVFTNNAFCAAPVQIAKQHINQTMPRYLVINAGNANAGTGAQGLKDALQTCTWIAEKLTLQNIIAIHKPNINKTHILPFSTGVIGEFLPMDKFKKGLDQAFDNLGKTNWLDAAKTIMTTDTKPKVISKEIIIDNQKATITGMIKGAGMIHPNMATLLAFIGTDVKISQDLLNKTWQQATQKSFNCISIDGDTSTNDAAMLFATQKGPVTITENNLDQWQSAITEIAQALAQMVIRDGEGATKFITIKVINGQTEQECHQTASTIATSPLVKTAFFASDPNWGRILAAIGRAGIENLDINKITIDINNIRIASQGGRDKNYTEEQGIKAMQPEEIVIVIDLQRGNESIDYWTADFSYDYVKINAEYRT